MKIETKFNFGDKVFMIWKKYDQQWIECSFCGGEGHIDGKDGKRILCPECYGRKGNTLNKLLKWQIETELTIGQIKIETTCGYEPENDTIFDNYGSQYDEYEEKYMCYETGVGSGTVHDVKNLFITDKEAQSECDKRNSIDQ